MNDERKVLLKEDLDDLVLDFMKTRCEVFEAVEHAAIEFKNREKISDADIEFLKTGIEVRIKNRLLERKIARNFMKSTR